MNNMIVKQELPFEIGIIIFRHQVVTADLNPRTMDATFFDCGPNWYLIFNLLYLLKSICMKA